MEKGSLQSYKILSADRELAVKKNIIISFADLGCAKNHADLESILGYLYSGIPYELSDKTAYQPKTVSVTEEPTEEKANILITQDLNRADFVIINTCAFLKEARKESINTINEILYNTTAKIIVSGCIGPWYSELKERYKNEEHIYFVNQIEEISDIIYSQLKRNNNSKENRQYHNKSAQNTEAQHKKQNLSQKAFKYIRKPNGYNIDNKIIQIH